MKNRLYKVLLVFFLGGMTTLPTYAQFSPNTSFGITGGLNVTDLRYFLEGNSNRPDSRLLTSFNLGMVADVSASRWVSIQPGLRVTGKGATLKEKTEDGNFSYRMHPWYLEIPVNLIIKPMANQGMGTGFFFGAGPYLAFALGGKGEYNGPDMASNDFYKDHSLKFGTKASKDMRGVDFGLHFLAGIAFSNSMLLGAEYGLGVTNLSPSDNGDAPPFLKNRTFSITLTIMFNRNNNYYY